jgi:hypothetical protein
LKTINIVGLTLNSDVWENILGEVMLDVGAGGNVGRELADVVFLRLRRQKMVIKATIIRTTPPATPPAIAATFVRDPVEVGGEVVDDGVADTRDDSVPVVRWASVMLKLSPS